MEGKVQKVPTFNPLQRQMLLKPNLQFHYSQRPQSEITPSRYVKTETTPIKTSQVFYPPSRKVTQQSNYQQKQNGNKTQEKQERPLSAIIKNPQLMINQNKGLSQNKQNENQNPTYSFLVKEQKKLQKLDQKSSSQELQKFQILTRQNYRNYLEFKKEKDEDVRQQIVHRAKSAKTVPQIRESNQNSLSYKQFQYTNNTQISKPEQINNIDQIRQRKTNKHSNEDIQILNQTYQLQYEMKPRSPPLQSKKNDKLSPYFQSRNYKAKEVYIDIQKTPPKEPQANSTRPLTEESKRTENLQIGKKIQSSNYQVRPITAQQKTDSNLDVKNEFYKQITAKNSDVLQKHQSTILNQQAFSNSSNLRSSSKLDEYIIGKIIGQGAYAVVKYGIHKPTNRKVAVKIYDKFKLLDPLKRKNVSREIQIMTKLSHPNIAQLIEAIDSSKQIFLVQEFCNGINLHQLVKKQVNRRLPEHQAKSIFQQIVAGISYCHKLDIAHRDLKLENILVDEVNNVVKIIDFGFSTMINKKIKIFCGTPSYMAPEIVNKKEFFGQPADIWALGVLLFAILCGSYPFRGSSDAELYKKISKAQYNIQENVSIAARELISKMLQIDPLKRPSANEILKNAWVCPTQNSSHSQRQLTPESSKKLRPQPPSRNQQVTAKDLSLRNQAFKNNMTQSNQKTNNQALDTLNNEVQISSNRNKNIKLDKNLINSIMKLGYTEKDIMYQLNDQSSKIFQLYNKLQVQNAIYYSGRMMNANSSSNMNESSKFNENVQNKIKGAN